MLAFSTAAPLSLRRPPRLCAAALQLRRPRFATRASAAPLLVVGAGVLGRHVGAQWLAAHPGTRVVAETRTDRTHAELAAEGMEPALAGEGGAVFKRVVFCAPPSGSKDYVADVVAAAGRVAEGGVFVFTSSGGVYKQKEGDAPLTEDSEVDAESERAGRLFKAETAALTRPEGRVVRLSGLYSLERGAHSFYLRASSEGKTLSGRGGSFVNLVHYEDAARMVVAVLERGSRGGPDARRVFLAADCSPVMRSEIAEEALAHPAYAGGRMPEFEETGPLVVKTYNNSASREELGWQPVWDNFAVFLKEDAAKRLAETL